MLFVRKIGAIGSDTITTVVMPSSIMRAVIALACSVERWMSAS